MTRDKKTCLRRCAMSKDSDQTLHSDHSFNWLRGGLHWEEGGEGGGGVGCEGAGEGAANSEVSYEHICRSVG